MGINPSQSAKVSPTRTHRLRGSPDNPRPKETASVSSPSEMKMMAVAIIRVYSLLRSAVSPSFTP